MEHREWPSYWEMPPMTSSTVEGMALKAAGSFHPPGPGEWEVLLQWPGRGWTPCPWTQQLLCPHCPALVSSSILSSPGLGLLHVSHLPSCTELWVCWASLFSALTFKSLLRAAGCYSPLANSKPSWFLHAIKTCCGPSVPCKTKVGDREPFFKKLNSNCRHFH